MEVGDVVIADSVAFSVTGVYLAPPGGQSTIGVSRMLKEKTREYNIPIEIIRALPIYRRVS